MGEVSSYCFEQGACAAPCPRKIRAFKHCYGTGTSFDSFASAIVLLVVVWNFMYIGGTMLLTNTYTALEKVGCTHRTFGALQARCPRKAFCAQINIAAGPTPAKRNRPP